MNLGRPKKLTVKPKNAEKTEFQFLLEFRGRDQPVEFFVTGDGAMMILHGLKEIQARYRIPIPDSIRPRGRPTLRVVLPDE